MKEHRAAAEVSAAARTARGRRNEQIELHYQLKSLCQPAILRSSILDVAKVSAGARFTGACLPESFSRQLKPGVQ